MTDLSHLMHLFRSDRAQVREWIDLYLRESPQYFDQLSSSMDRGDARAFAAAAHDLQPQAHYLNAQCMVELLVGLEEQALTKGTSTCVEMLAKLFIVRDTIHDELLEVLKDL